MRDMRLGRFKVSQELLNEASREVLQTLFKDVVVLKAQHDHINGHYDYVANHPAFEVVEKNQVISEYRALLNLGNDTVKWEKI